MSAHGRVLLFSTNMGLTGGAEEQVMHLGLGLRARGWEVEIVSMLPPGILPAELAAAGIAVRTLNMRPGVPDPRGLWRLLGEMRRFQPDVLHSHMTHANLMARLARRWRPVPVLLCTLHGMKMHSVRGGATRWREMGHRLTDRWADLTTTICNAAAASYLGSHSVPKDKLAVVPNGVDTARFRPDPEIRARMRQAFGFKGDFVWLAVGRLVAPKAYPVMLAAFHRYYRASGGAAVLLICGQGPEGHALREQARALGISGRVRFLGIRRDIPELMNAADAFVMSSETEGLPMALLQASSCALPIAATDVGGNAEVVREGATGFLARPSDPEALAAAMERIASLSARERAGIGAAARAATRAAYGLDSVIERWERIYGALLRRASPGLANWTDRKTISQGEI